MLDSAHADMRVVRGAWQHGPKEALGCGDREFLELPIGRAGAIHAGETGTHRPFGEGMVDFKELIPHLLAVPNIEWWCVDLCFWTGWWELVEPSRGFVEELLNRNAAA